MEAGKLSSMLGRGFFVFFSHYANNSSFISCRMHSGHCLLCSQAKNIACMVSKNKADLDVCYALIEVLLL